MRTQFVALLAAFAVTYGAIAGATAQEERLWRPPAGGQSGGDISLYRAPNYQGSYLRVQTAVPDIGSGIIRSIRIGRGQWALCTGANYTGQCSTLSQSLATVSMLSSFGRTRSLRPAADNPAPSGGGASGPTLRGMAGAFYSAPSYRGQRIPACARGQATPACARTTAGEFCRVNGYNFVGNVAQQSVSGRVYLADVLCKRSAN